MSFETIWFCMPLHLQRVSDHRVSWFCVISWFVFATEPLLSIQLWTADSDDLTNPRSPGKFLAFGDWHHIMTSSRQMWYTYVYLVSFWLIGSDWWFEIVCCFYAWGVHSTKYCFWCEPGEPSGFPLQNTNFWPCLGIPQRQENRVCGTLLPVFLVISCRHWNRFGWFCALGLFLPEFHHSQIPCYSTVVVEPSGFPALEKSTGIHLPSGKPAYTHLSSPFYIFHWLYVGYVWLCKFADDLWEMASQCFIVPNWWINN